MLKLLNDKSIKVRHSDLINYYSISKQNQWGAWSIVVKTIYIAVGKTPKKSSTISKKEKDLEKLGRPGWVHPHFPEEHHWKAFWGKGASGRDWLAQGRGHVNKTSDSNPPVGLRRDHNYSGRSWAAQDVLKELDKVEVPQVIHLEGGLQAIFGEAPW